MKKKIRAYFYFVPCYFNIETDELTGRNFIYDKLLDFCTWFHQFFNLIFDLKYEFPIKINMNDLTDDDVAILKRKQGII